MVTLKEYFTLHINSVFLFLGFINVVSGCLIYNKYSEKSKLVDSALYIIPGTMATLGGITIGISIMGCFGMALRNKMNSIVFFSVNLTIMFVEIVLGCYWWYGNKQFMQFPELLNWFLQDDVNTGEDWATLQIKSNCCGVNNAYDYIRLNRSIPSHCCQKNNLMRTYLKVWMNQICYVTNVQKPGCTARLVEDFRGDQKIIISQLLISGMVKATILAASFVIPFEQKVLLTETHDAISIASTVSLEDPENIKEAEESPKPETPAAPVK